MDGIESNIDKAETRKTEIETQMTSEDFFKTSDHLKLTEEHKILANSLEKHYSEWSEISDEIDGITKEHDDIINNI